MRRVYLGLFWIILLSVHAYGFQEGFLVPGIIYKNQFYTSDTELLGNVKMAGGFSFGSHVFWNDQNIGLFSQVSLGFPVYANETLNTDNYGGGLLDLLIGPGFRYGFTGRLTFMGGLGGYFSMDSLNITVRTSGLYKATHINMGLGAQAGLKFDITNTINLTFGVNAGYTFLNYTNIYESFRQDTSGWGIKSIFGVAPFIGIGFNRFINDGWETWGKPSKNNRSIE
jgi:hypothetical protein